MANVQMSSSYAFLVIDVLGRSHIRMSAQESIGNLSHSDCDDWLNADLLSCNLVPNGLYFSLVTLTPPNY